MNKQVKTRELRGIVSLRADASDPKAAIEAVNKAFEEFKATNDDNIKAAAKGAVDALSKDKLDRIESSISDLMSSLEKSNAEIDAQAEKLASAQLGVDNSSIVDPEENEYSNQFLSWFKDGANESELKAAHKVGGVRADMSAGSDADGGFTAPVEWDRTITDKRVEVSEMRRYASVQTVNGKGFKKLYNVHGATSGWVGETAARPKTSTSQFAEYAFSFGELYANPAASQGILDDSEINIVNWLTGEVNLEFSKQEGLAFITGDGVNKPKGFLNFDATTEGALAPALQHPLGPIQEVKSGAAAALTSDGLIDLVYSLPSDRSQGAELFSNNKTHGVIRKMKDGDGNYLWQAPFQAGQPALVLGVPLNELSGMPDVAANAFAVAYGNMAQTYRIFDRVGMRMLRDPYTNKPFVQFYTTKRVGGGLWNPEFMRYHKIAA